MWYTDIRIQTFVTLFCGVVGLIKFSQLSLNDKFILWIVWQNFLVDVFASYLAYHQTPNTWLYNLHLPIQYSLTLLYYSTLLKANKKPLAYLGVAVIISFSVINSIYIQQGSFHTYTLFFSGSLIAIASYLLLRNYVVEESSLFSKLSFWFIAANFIYFIISINSLNSIPLARKISQPTALKLIYINYFAYILWSILIATGFLCIPKKTTSYSL